MQSLETNTDSQAELTQLKSLLVRAIGHESLLDRSDLLLAAIRRRQRKTGATSDADYFHNLKGMTGLLELEALIDELTIGETCFFRYRSQFDALRCHFQMLESKIADIGRPIRIWSAGCSIGAEPYSVAIVAEEMRATGQLTRPVEIIGTDINGRHLDIATKAAYRAWTLRELASDETARWFEQSDTGYRLRERYRRPVRFLRQNLLASPAPENTGVSAPFDVIMCCNVMIYFDYETNKQLLEHFRQALSEDGILLIGHADYTPVLSTIFDASHLGDVLVYRRHAAHANAGGAYRHPAKRTPEKPSLPPSEKNDPCSRAKASYAQQPDAAAVKCDLAPAANNEAVSQFVELRSLLNTANWREAERLLAKILHVTPAHAHAHYYQSLVLLAQGDRKGSEEALRRTLYLDPAFAIARYELAQRYLAEDKVRAAHRELGIVLDILEDLPADQAMPPDDEICTQELRSAVELLLSYAELV